MRGDTAKCHIFLYTFCCRLAVGNCISRSTVEQSVVSPSSTRCKIEAFYEQYFEPAHSAVTRSAGTGGSGTDDNNVVTPWRLYVVCHNEGGLIRVQCKKFRVSTDERIAFAFIASLFRNKSTAFIFQNQIKLAKEFL